MKMRMNICLAGLGCLALALIVGCGDGSIKTESVTGVVTLDSKPLEGATVNFSPAVEGKGDASFGKTDAEGRYKLQTVRGKADAGTTPGEYIVTVSKTEMIETGKMLPTPEGKQVPEMKPKEGVPAKYTNGKTSGFKATVVNGKNNFDFELKTGG
jgi:hypothetical protein